MSNDKVFSGLALLPKGRASSDIIDGCMVLEGGAFRGVYSEGVLDALMEAGINLQTTVGTSAGALNGLNYVSGQIGRSARMNLEYRHDSRYVGTRAYINNKGVVGFDFALENFKDYPFDEERFMDPSRRFIAVATNVKTGKAEYLEKGIVSNPIKAAQASASMPIFSSMVELDGNYYLDGGCADKIPFQWAIDQGFDKIVVVKTRPDDFRKGDMPESEKKAIRTVFRNYPEFCDAFIHSDENYNKQCDEIARQARRKNLFTIAPSKTIDVSRLEGNMEKLGELYYLGYHDGRKAIPELKKYLGID